MHIKKQVGPIFAIRIGNALAQLIVVSYFARVLGPAAIGIFFLFQTILGIGGLLGDLGLNSGLEKRLSEGEKQNEYLSSSLILKLVPLSIVSIFIFVFKSEINSYLGGDLAYLLVVMILLQEISQAYVIALRGELRVIEAESLQFLQKWLWILGSGILLSFGYESLALIYSLLGAMIVKMALASYRTEISITKPTKESIHSIWDFSKYSVFSSIGGHGYRWVDVAIIGAVLSQSFVGMYEVAWRLTMFAMIFSHSISSAIFPQMSEWSANDAVDKIRELVNESIQLSLMIIIPAFFGCLALSTEILSVISGSEYSAAGGVLIVLMSEKVFQSMRVILFRALEAVDRPELPATSTVTSLLLNLLFNLPLTIEFGILGAAVGTSAAFALNTIIHAFYAKKTIGGIVFVGPTFRWILFSSVVMYFGILLFKSRFEITGVPSLLVTIALGILLYMLSALSSKSLRDELKLLLPIS